MKMRSILRQKSGSAGHSTQMLRWRVTMRGPLIQIAVFVGVYCLTVGYCRWGAREETEVTAYAGFADLHDAYVVECAADETFDGVYLPAAAHGGRPCFAKDDPPRFLWQSESRWYLSTKPGALADGYMTQIGAPAIGEWLTDGGPSPAPVVRAGDLGDITPPASPQ